MISMIWVCCAAFHITYNCQKVLPAILQPVWPILTINSYSKWRFASDKFKACLSGCFFIFLDSCLVWHDAQVGVYYDLSFLGSCLRLLMKACRHPNTTLFLITHAFYLPDCFYQVVEDGYEFFADRQLVTIFSAPNYCGEFDNAGAMMSVDETLMCSFQILRPADRRSRLSWKQIWWL